MGSSNDRDPEIYRVWLAGYGDWEPRRWSDIPPSSIALRPAEPGCMTAEQATQYIESFNAAMLVEPKNVWAVGVRVAVHYRGDLNPGQTIAARQLFTQPQRREAG